MPLVAGSKAGGFDNYQDAQKTMTGLKPKAFQPDPQAHAVYEKIYSLYRKLHDSFGTQQPNSPLYGVMKELIQIRNEARS